MAFIDQIGVGARVVLEPVRGAGVILRLVQRIIGAGLVIAAAMLWVAPGAIWDWDIVLMKLALTGAAGFCGMSFLNAARIPQGGVEIEVDVACRVVRVIRWDARGSKSTRNCGFDALGRAELAHGIVGLWDQDGVHLADVSVREADVRRLLVPALQNAGKL
ncbi:MAG: hypothetical protein AAGF60_00035 [Pseudomonadota bacterium]